MLAGHACGCHELSLKVGNCGRGVDLLVLGIIAYSAIGALNPKSPTFSSANQRDVKKRPSGKPRMQQGML